MPIKIIDPLLDRLTPSPSLAWKEQPKVSRYQPKTLAKTIHYIAYHAPGEFGLFWDPDGTMPWKELYWALQEDPSLRFVRESHMRELDYLGLDLPFRLEDNLLRLKENVPPPVYPPAEPPPRLFHGCPRKRYTAVSRNGLRPSGNRAFVPLTEDEDRALSLAQRRDPDPLLIRVTARDAVLREVVFREADHGLYLVEAVSPDLLVLPPMDREELDKLKPPKKKDKGDNAKAKPPSPPGSFMIDAGIFQEEPPRKKGKVGKKGKKGPVWKQEARKERKNRREP